MAELTTVERLQPSLIDRLTDDEPEKQTETRERRVMTMPQLRQAVLRDLNWLLNASSRPLGDEIHKMPNAGSSVVNFGMPDLTGMSSSGVALSDVERMVTKAIRAFEPRIMRAGMEVKAVTGGSADDHNVLSLEISGDLWARPLPESLYIRTEVDLETGRFHVRERAGV
jgi:type VI secretion system protein ImpF